MISVKRFRVIKHSLEKISRGHPKLVVSWHHYIDKIQQQSSTQRNSQQCCQPTALKQHYFIKIHVDLGMKMIQHILYLTPSPVINDYLIIVPRFSLWWWLTPVVLLKFQSLMCSCFRYLDISLGVVLLVSTLCLLYGSYSQVIITIFVLST